MLGRQPPKPVTMSRPPKAVVSLYNQPFQFKSVVLLSLGRKSHRLSEVIELAWFLFCNTMDPKPPRCAFVFPTVISGGGVVLDMFVLVYAQLRIHLACAFLSCHSTQLLDAGNGHWEARGNLTEAALKVKLPRASGEVTFRGLTWGMSPSTFFFGRFPLLK